MSAQDRTPEKVRHQDNWYRAFLSALRETGNVRFACEAAGIGRRTAYDARERLEWFAKAWALAKEDSADLLELEALRRARDGVPEPVIYKGRLATEEVVTANGAVRRIPLTIQRYSDTLLIFLIKGVRPDKFRERISQEVSGSIDVNVEAEVDRALRELAIELATHDAAAEAGGAHGSASA